MAGVRAESLPGWKGLELMLEAAVLLSQHTRRWGQVRECSSGSSEWEESKGKQGNSARLAAYGGSVFKILKPASEE